MTNKKEEIKTTKVAAKKTEEKSTVKKVVATKEETKVTDKKSETKPTVKKSTTKKTASKSTKSKVVAKKTKPETKGTEERNRRHSFVGKVVSTKNTKTIAVLVETYKPHPIYKKRVRYSKKYQAHDENSIAKLGDKVRITETRPLSASKRFRLTKVITKKER